MRLRLPTWIAFAAVVAGWTGCCNHPEEFHYSIRPEARTLIPYTLASDFEMRHASGETVRFHTIWEHENEVVGGSCNDCCAQEYISRYYLYLEADSADLRADLQLTQTGQEGELSPTKFQISLDGAIYFADFVDGHCSAQAGLTCLDSVNVSGVTYYNVMEFQNQSTANGAPDTRLLYDPTVGIIRFTERGTAEYWELVP